MELQTTSFIESTGSPILILLAITEYKCKVFLYCYSPAVTIEPATSISLSPAGHSVTVWYTPLAANPVLINFFKPIPFRASDSSSEPAGVSHISSLPQKKYNRESGRKKKEQTNNMDLCQLQT